MEGSHLETVVDSDNQEVVDLGVQKVVDLAAHVADLAMVTASRMVLMTMGTKMKEIGEVLVVEVEEALRTLVIEIGGLGALAGVDEAEEAEGALVEEMTAKGALENQKKMAVEVAEALVVVLGEDGAEEAEVALVEEMIAKVALKNQKKMVAEALVVVVVLGEDGAGEVEVGLVEEAGTQKEEKEKVSALHTF